VPYHLVSPSSEIAQCRQIILVRAPNWESTIGDLQLFERNRGGKWIPVQPGFPCVLGKKGLGWGIGLHGTGLPRDPRKWEGDGKAPAGVFRLNSCMGVVKETAGLHFPYRQLTATTEGVDDPRSRYYNRVVDRKLVDRVDWTSAEQMVRSDELYRWIVIVEHNWKPYAGLGSCIFLHTWQGQGVPTTGCTAMSRDHLEFLIHWLNVRKHPLLVQLPEAVYVSVQQNWQLP
jgi:L,D-peptidoglycan transpeptidase YkuD (ErfK/YbiS/YcfS/YnhG family)